MPEMTINIFISLSANTIIGKHYNFVKNDVRLKDGIIKWRPVPMSTNVLRCHDDYKPENMTIRMLSLKFSVRDTKPSSSNVSVLAAPFESRVCVCVCVCIRFGGLSGTDVWLCMCRIRAGSGDVRVGAVRLLSVPLTFTAAANQALSEPASTATEEGRAAWLC